MDLNEILLKFVCDNEVYDISSYSSMSSMSRIVLEGRIPNFFDKIKNRFGISKSFMIAYDFFDFLGSKYRSYFVSRVNSGDIDLHYFKNNEELSLSYMDDFGNKKIYLPYGRDITDCFALVHEIFHDMNLINDFSVARGMFTEYISYCSEIFLNDFILSTYGLDFSSNFRYVYNSCYIEAIKVDFQIVLLKLFLDKGSISDYDVACIISCYNSYFRDELINVYKEILEDESLIIDENGGYVISTLLCCYTRDLIVNKRFDVDMLKFLNENINCLRPEDVYSILDLDVVDDNYVLSTDSYTKLSKSYNKYMR